MANNCLFHTGG